MEEICKNLNKLIDEKKDGFIDEVNAIIAKLYKDGGAMYWDMEIFIDFNGDDEKMRDLVRKSNKVRFFPSDDPTEHKGVVIRYKNPKVIGDELGGICDGLTNEKIEKFYELMDSVGIIDKFFGYIDDGEEKDDMVKMMVDEIQDLADDNSFLYIFIDYYKDLHEVPYWIALERVAEAAVTDIMAGKEKQN